MKGGQSQFRNWTSSESSSTLDADVDACHETAANNLHSYRRLFLRREVIPSLPPRRELGIKRAHNRANRVNTCDASPAPRPRPSPPPAREIDAHQPSVEPRHPPRETGDRAERTRTFHLSTLRRSPTTFRTLYPEIKIPRDKRGAEDHSVRIEPNRPRWKRACRSEYTRCRDAGTR